MKLIRPSFLIWEQEPGLEGIYKAIERAGRVCYKSEDKITDDSAKPFVDRMIKSGHGAMLEHGTVYLHSTDNFGGGYYLLKDKYNKNSYSKVKIIDNPVTRTNHIYISTNMRVLIENNWLDDLEYLCEPTEFHEKRVTVHFVCDRGVLAEFTRHRTFSFSAESTRYCNYSKDKFGNELTFIIPCWADIPEGKYTNIAKQSNEDGEYKQIMIHENNTNAYPLTTTPEGRFLWNCYWNEHDYFDLLNYDWKPQQARAVLPNALKTELVMTGFVSDWKHFFGLRCAPNAHPQARELAIPLSDEFVKRGYINE